MRTSARPSPAQTALLLSKAKIEDEEEPGRATAKKERKSRCTTVLLSIADVRYQTALDCRGFSTLVDNEKTSLILRGRDYAAIGPWSDTVG